MAILDDGSGLLWSDGMSSAFSFSTKAVARKIAGIRYGQMVVLFADGSMEEVTLTTDNGASTMPLVIPGAGPGVGAADVAGSATGWCAAVADGHVACTSVRMILAPRPQTSSRSRSGSTRPACSHEAARSAAGAGRNLVVRRTTRIDGYISVALGEAATAITAAETFACALLASGGVKCWGPGDNCIAAGSPPPCDFGTYIVAGSVGRFADGFAWEY